MMFTGIVEELGIVKRMEHHRIAISASAVLEGTRIGDSIAVNGVCLTVVEIDAKGFSADVMPETLRSSNLGELHVGDSVDLERALLANGRFGGHIVSGHIDGVGRIREVRVEQNARIVTIEAPRSILDLIVEKGSIAIDGISLTVVDVTSSSFTVSVIPHTAEKTVLLAKQPGATVNLENDIVGKYVQKLLGNNPTSNLTLEYLQSNGF